MGGRFWKGEGEESRAGYGARESPVGTYVERRTHTCALTRVRDYKFVVAIRAYACAYTRLGNYNIFIRILLCTREYYVSEFLIGYDRVANFHDYIVYFIIYCL